MRRLKNIWRLLTSKFLLVCFLLLIQIALLPTFIILASLYSQAIFWAALALLLALNLILAVYIVNTGMNAAYKIAWILTILLLPPMGCIAFLLLRRRPTPRKTLQKLQGDFEAASCLYTREGAPLPPSFDGCDDFSRQCATYITRHSRLPATDCTEYEYFDIGEKYAKRLIEELKKAEKYIFLEYFIIREGHFWGTVLEILLEKRKQGVDVRVIYDDIGSMFKVPGNYAEMLEKQGIPCICFNRFRPVLDTAQNNRTHRKIAVIDGRVAFTGGINLSDEYTNETHPLGHWKDTGILVRGRAVQNFTAMFLQFWALKAGEPDYHKYVSDAPQGDLPCLAFCDSPLDDEHNLCEDLYLRIIYNAKKSVYIYTPYLIPDEEMKRALLTAARSGVDVRIVIPEIPDKKYVFAVTKAFYSELVGEGIKIYRYTPGFIHAKSIVGDGKYCVLGTSNIDFRSFYLHFECDMMFFDERVSGEVEKDFLATCEKSALVTPDQIKTSLPQLIYRSLLRIFAPLM